jgi:tetratricopeptide (TPR) repeat protein
MAEPVLTACLIVRDEEPFLPRCLRSVAPYADETVVVDTGSADRTCEIAKESGARLFEHPWQEDFSEARNRAIEESRGRYLFFLDADEWVEAGPHPAALRALLSRAGAEAYAVEIRDVLDGGVERRRHLPRLFRNGPARRYRGRFAEELEGLGPEPNGGAVSSLALSGLVLAHDGNRIAQRAGRGRAARNLACLARWIHEEKDAAAPLYHAARETLWIKHGRAVRGSGARRALAFLDAMGGPEGIWPPTLRADAARLRAACLLACDRPRQALAALDGAGPSVPCELLRAEAEIGLRSEEPGLLERAIGRLETLFDRDTAGPDGWQEPSLSGAVARARLAEALLVAGRPEEAEQAAEWALSLPGGGAAGWIARASVRRFRGKTLEALHDLVEALRSDPADPWAWASTGEILLERGAASEAIEPLRRACLLAPGWDRADEALAAALFLSGRDQELGQEFSGQTEDELGPGGQAVLLLAAAAGTLPPPRRVLPEAAASARRILERLARAGRPDLLERLALGLRTTVVTEAAP